jgi:hypothetical protein
MEQRFAAAHRQNIEPERCQTIYAAKKLLCRNGRRNAIVLVAISAGEIASAGHNHMREERRGCREETSRNHSEFARHPVQPLRVPLEYQSRACHPAAPLDHTSVSFLRNCCWNGRYPNPTAGFSRRTVDTAYKLFRGDYPLKSHRDRTATKMCSSLQCAGLIRSSEVA